MTERFIINADDFGVSAGVNEAVEKAFRAGALNSASIMATAPLADQAFAFAAANPALRAGVHLNLTSQRLTPPACNPTRIPLLVDAGGGLRHGFVSLLRLSLMGGKPFREQAEWEMRAQIELALNKGLRPTHLDSHRHVHAIPALYGIVRNLSKEYGIPRVRVVNESFFATVSRGGFLQCLASGGLIKYAVLRTLFRADRAASAVYFYSILHTTKLFGKNLNRIRVPKGFEAVELCIHPSVVATDRASGDPALEEFLLFSPDRQKEYEALLDARLRERFVFES